MAAKMSSPILNRSCGPNSVTMLSILEPKNELSIVSTFSVLMSLYMAALAVVSLYLEIPNVQDGKWNTGLILLMIKGRSRQV